MTMLSLEKNQYSGNISEIYELSGFTVGLTSYRASRSDHLLHYHSNPHISFVLEGGHLEKRKKQEYERLAGDVLFCNSGEPHQFVTPTDSKNINIEFEPIYLENNGISEMEIERTTAISPRANLAILRIFREMEEIDDVTQLSVESILLELITNPIVIEGSKKPQWFRYLLEILNDEWNQPLSLDELSRCTQVHPVTISKYFPKYMQCTLGQYRRQLRISRSLGFIKNSNLSLTEISFTCGFSDQSHFIRTFKHMTGYLPKEFQKL